MYTIEDTHSDYHITNRRLSIVNLLSSFLPYRYEKVIYNGVYWSGRISLPITSDIEALLSKLILNTSGKWNWLLKDELTRVCDDLGIKISFHLQETYVGYFIRVRLDDWIYESIIKRGYTHVQSKQESL